MTPQDATTGTPLRITINVSSLMEGRHYLEVLTEERLVAGGTMIAAEGIHWVGGKIQKKLRKEVTAYTTLEQLPLIRERLDQLCDGDEPPTISQYVADDKKATVSWIERNVRS